MFLILPPPSNDNFACFLSLFFEIILGLASLGTLGYMIYLLIGIFKNRYPYECKFDRLNGTVTFPSMNTKGEVMTVPFSRCVSELHLAEVTHSSRGGTFVDKRKKHIDIMYNKHFITNFTLRRYSCSYDTILTDILKHFSFLMWYMDKNRPLPLGKILDPYRKQDYERRKLAKFPKPLIHSNITMTDFDCVERFGIKKDRYEGYIYDIYISRHND